MEIWNHSEGVVKDDWGKISFWKGDTRIWDSVRLSRSSGKQGEMKGEDRCDCEQETMILVYERITRQFIKTTTESHIQEKI